VWDIREDRKGLQKLLGGEESLRSGLSPDKVASIVNHPSRFVDEAAAIFDFINEIGQVETMKAAATRQAGLPPGNWIHRFTTFDEIVDALEIGFRISVDIQKLILTANLKEELASNMREILTKNKKGDIYPRCTYGVGATKRVAGGMDESTTLPSIEVLGLISSFLIASGIGRRMSRRFLGESLRLGVFMKFVPARGEFCETPLYRALLELDFLLDRLALTETAVTCPQPLYHL
jgi:hypothetical protein